MVLISTGNARSLQAPEAGGIMGSPLCPDGSGDTSFWGTTGLSSKRTGAFGGSSSKIEDGGFGNDLLEHFFPREWS